MTKQKESIILTYSITLDALSKGRVPITSPTNKTLSIHYIIFANGPGDFAIRNSGIKHWVENRFILYGSTLNQLLYLIPQGIVREAGASIKVENLTNAEDTLNFTIVGDIE